MAKTINLWVNGISRQLDSDNLGEVIHILNYHSHWLATAVNGELVSRDERNGFKLYEGDRIEILSPMQGG